MMLNRLTYYRDHEWRSEQCLLFDSDLIPFENRYCGVDRLFELR